MSLRTAEARTIMFWWKEFANETHMHSNRMTAVTAGILFIIATVTNVVATQLSSPLLNDSSAMIRIAANSNVVNGGAFLELIAAGACAGIAITLYPVLRQWNAGLALGSVVFRTIEAVMYTIGVVSLLSLLTLSQQFTRVTASDRTSIQATGDLLLAMHQQVVVPAVLAFSLGAVMYYVVFYQSRLIPRWLSGWGIAATILSAAACLLAWFNQNPVVTYTILWLPIAVQEMVLAVWLIARGFNASALQSGAAMRDSVATTQPKSLTRIMSGVTT